MHQKRNYINGRRPKNRSGREIFRKRLRGFRDDTSGVLAIVTAIIFPIMVGMAGVGVDVSDWYEVRREMQAAADGAAISGAWELNSDPDNAAIIAEANALRNNFRDQATATIIASSPPTSGPFAGDATAVQVNIQNQLELFFSSIFLSSPVSASVTATAIFTTGADLCVLSLAETGTGISLSGSANISLGCGILSNSISDDSVTLGGNTEITASPIASAGQIDVSGGPTINTSSEIEGAARGTNPYADLVVPAPASCDADHTNVAINSDTVLSPGTYCGGIRINSGAVVTLDPGEFIIDNGDLDIRGGASVSGDEITVLLTSSDGNNFGNLKYNGGSDISLSAPTSGSFSGVLFFQDPDAPSFQGANTISNKFLGGADLDVTGALYFPSQELDFSGGTDVNSSCVQLIALSVTFSGNAALGNNCDAAGTAPLGLSVVRLVD